MPKIAPLFSKRAETRPQVQNAGNEPSRPEIKPFLALSTIRQTVNRLEGMRKSAEKAIKTNEDLIKSYTIQKERLEQAGIIIHTVSQQTQEQLRIHVSELSTMALAAVYPDDPYDLDINLVTKRDQTEAELRFSRDGQTVHPTLASGGGPCDVAAWALRVSLWSLRKPRPASLMVLDEPFRFMHKDRLGAMGIMLKDVAKKLGLQFIIVTQEPTLAENADRVFLVSKSKGRSQVKEQT
jgi:DNA repair exonuclease SbcCD ATPase subunit